MPRFATTCVLVLASCLAASAARPAPYPGHPVTSASIDAQDLSERVKALSDDAFEGRGPGTPAGEAAADWVAQEMRRIGLQPGNHGSYFQTVPAVTISLEPEQSSFQIASSKGTLTPQFLNDIVYLTPNFSTPDIRVRNSPLVFVGYGAVAPEYHWDDYAGVDVRGKTVVILINDPGNEDAHPDPKFFQGKAMTYYGRWTYKYEEAARHGAAAAIIVHEEGPAGVGWQVIRNTHSGDRLWLDSKDKNAGMVPIQAWITVQTAQELFRKAGMNYEDAKAAANKRGFHAVPMGDEKLNVSAHSKLSHMTTRNVIGVIPGSVHPDQYVLYSAHWDHLGMKPGVPGPDKIYNGAVDNAMGVAGILEIAEAIEHGDRPKRSVAFASWTLEESAILGSEYFARFPPWPLSHIVAGVNLDANLPEGPAHDMVVVGSGSSQLEDVLAGVLKKTGRVISPDPNPEKGLYFRSDHFSLAVRGVPMIYPKGGVDLVNGGKAAGYAVRDQYLLHKYHQPTDEWSKNWDLSGPVADLEVLKDFGLAIANSEQWPNWYPGNQFKAAHDRMMAQDNVTK
jgi:Zn-dependent M28 family amino/carboxypeptidase